MRKPHKEIALGVRGLKSIVHMARVIAARAIGLLIEVDLILSREESRLESIAKTIEEK